MESGKNIFLKKWVTGNLAVYFGALGFFHPLIAHGFTGDHGKLLTTPQFIMHTLSLFVFVFLLVRTQNKTFQMAGKRKTLAGIWPFLLFTPWVFWLGYYTLFVPFDILFMFLSIGIINAIQLKPLVKFPTKWVWQCILGYFLAAVAGIVIGLGAYLLFYKNIQGIARDMATWLSISIPAALVVAFFFRYILKKQVIMPEDYESDSMPEQKVSLTKVAMLIPFICSAVLAGCSKNENDKDSPESPETKKGIVSGVVTDAKNLPVKDARITIEHTVWYNSYLFASSDNEGKYQVSLPDDPAGDWTAKARLIKTAYGQTYQFDLEPDKTDAFNKASGAVRNFKWKLSGQRPGGTGYYGAHVDLYQFGADVDMTKIKLSFTPFPGEASLIDGTTTASFERSVEEVAGTFMVKDVPIGKYTIKAEYAGKKLLLNNRHIDDNNEESKTVVFGKYGYLGETEYNIEFYLTE
jgi:hypothetical protein